MSEDRPFAGSGSFPCPECDFTANTKAGLGSHRRSRHAGESVPSNPAPRDDDLGGSSPFTAEQRPGSGLGGAEPAPAAAKRGLFGRLRREKPAKSVAAAPTREARPRAGRGKRTSADTMLGMGVEVLAEFAGATPYQCTARMLEIEAPYAGYVLDEAVAGSMLDRILLQPAVRAQDRFMAVGSVLGPPMLVAMIERDPSEANLRRMIPLLKRSLRMSAPWIVRGLKKKRAADAALEEALVELEEMGAWAEPEAGPAKPTPLDPLIRAILAPLVARAAQAAPEEEAS